MGRKAKKKVEKEIPKPPHQEFELDFSDQTIIEANGDFKKVKYLMENPTPVVATTPANAPAFRIPDFISLDEWTIKSDLTISSQFGQGFFVLDFKHDGKIYIVEYIGSRDVYFNHDLSYLSRWAQVSGWAVPRPIESVIRDNLTFWKHMWKVLLVDSEYLDIRYGIRTNLDMRTADENTEIDEE